MSILRVDVPGKAETSYEIRIEPGGLARLADVCAIAPAHRYAIIADSHVAELYGRRALAAMTTGGLEAELFVFPAGEWNKSAECWADLCSDLVRFGFGRDSACVALGGGVTGDLAGFVASTYKRGVPIVQVPTTLLSMVDSSVGGKTGIDAGHVKNAVGTFHHPAAVLIDPELLSTLPKYQRISGIAEAVKAAAIRDEAFFEWIEEHAELLKAGDLAVTTELIERSVRIKAEVVRADPEERGLRAILNFGHTFGHALESVSGFAVLHGEAVAAGMLAEAYFGEEIGITESGTGDRLAKALFACGLPQVLDDEIDLEALLEAAQSDKKVREETLRWVLLSRIGRVAEAGSGVSHAVPAHECRVPLAAALKAATADT